ncbi:hypothetical protein AJ79_02759 [Helicocarpus griseus UAMH5409]|uniref:F-box domain-containing protein n=1 Tax=Helicocarpus griseus UAMH5409 TaxID=1447875 RepID=A0A2B7Y0A1_9EURO|nr:hypothetical protein AJ79_02759 [Helicocarpus griseus UAMH5409]
MSDAEVSEGRRQRQLLVKAAPELLLEILEYLGVEFFRENVARLAICKHCYTLAYERIFLADVKLTAKGLERFLNTRQTRGKVRQMESVIRSVTVELHGFQDLTSVLPAGTDFKYEPSSYAINKAIEDCYPKLEKWNDQLFQNLLRLDRFMQGCHSLESFRFGAFAERLLFPDQPPRSVWRRYLYQKAVPWIICNDNITTLDLDICYTSLRKHGAKPKHHICSAIAVLLPQLHRLRLRMPHICPVALQPADNEDGTSPVVSLKEVIVNLDMTEESPGVPNLGGFKHNSGGCNRYSFETFDSLITRIEKQATLLAVQLNTGNCESGLILSLCGRRDIL